MQVTRKLTISEALQGAQVDDDMPVGWLSSFVQRVKAATDGMQPGEVHVRGAANIYAEWSHTLTREEEVAARLDDARARLGRIKAMLPNADGIGLSPEQIKLLREALG